MVLMELGRHDDEPVSEKLLALGVSPPAPAIVVPADDLQGD